MKVPCQASSLLTRSTAEQTGVARRAGDREQASHALARARLRYGTTGGECPATCTRQTTTTPTSLWHSHNRAPAGCLVRVPKQTSVTHLEISERPSVRDIALASLPMAPSSAWHGASRAGVMSGVTSRKCCDTTSSWSTTRVAWTPARDMGDTKRPAKGDTIQQNKPKTQTNTGGVGCESPHAMVTTPTPTARIAHTIGGGSGIAVREDAGMGGRTAHGGDSR